MGLLGFLGFGRSSSSLNAIKGDMGMTKHHITQLKKSAAVGNSAYFSRQDTCSHLLRRFGESWPFQLGYRLDELKKYYSMAPDKFRELSSKVQNAKGKCAVCKSVVEQIKGIGQHETNFAKLKSLISQLEREIIANLLNNGTF